MPTLQLIPGPDPIFKKKAQPVTRVDSHIRQLIDAMLDLLYREQGVGMGANMAGLLERIIVVDLQEGGKRSPLAMVNPEILWKSGETQTFTEASLCFPGISADITRPKAVRVKYLDRDGTPREMEAEGWLATVLQHEIDYLDGILFLDYLSTTKRSMLLRKLKKTRKG